MVCMFKNYNNFNAKTVGHRLIFLILEGFFDSFVALMN